MIGRENVSPWSQSRIQFSPRASRRDRCRPSCHRKRRRRHTNKVARSLSSPGPRAQHLCVEIVRSAEAGTRQRDSPFECVDRTPSYLEGAPDPCQPRSARVARRRWVVAGFGFPLRSLRASRYVFADGDSAHQVGLEKATATELARRTEPLHTEGGSRREVSRRRAAHPVRQLDPGGQGSQDGCVDDSARGGAEGASAGVVRHARGEAARRAARRHSDGRLPAGGPVPALRPSDPQEGGGAGDAGKREREAVGRLSGLQFGVGSRR